MSLLENISQWLRIRIDTSRPYWEAIEPIASKIIYLNTPMAIRPTVLGHTVPIGYRLSCLYFGAPLVDRTSTLDHGYPVQIIDPFLGLQISSNRLGPVADPTVALSELCLARARTILQRARKEQREIRVLWSGGIDSTAVACALLREADPSLDRLTFFYSKESVTEYRKFYKKVLKKNQSCTRISSVDEVLGTSALIVSGEHGDQIFGSMKALKIPWEELNAPWQIAFPAHLEKVMGSKFRVSAVLDYLRPQIEAAPVPLNSFLDLLWWINFSMKWQSVALRIPAQMRPLVDKSDIDNRKPKNPLDQLALTEHFFRSIEFQHWALTYRDAAVESGDWRSYKQPLKNFIFDFNGDSRYLKKKQKIPSLNQVLKNARGAEAMAILKTGESHKQPIDTTLKSPVKGYEVSGDKKNIEYNVIYTYSRERTLWDDFDSDGE